MDNFIKTNNIFYEIIYTMINILLAAKDYALSRYEDSDRHPKPDFSPDVVVREDVFPPKDRYAAFSYVFTPLDI